MSSLSSNKIVNTVFFQLFLSRIPRVGCPVMAALGSWCSRHSMNSCLYNTVQSKITKGCSHGFPSAFCHGCSDPSCLDLPVLSRRSCQGSPFNCSVMIVLSWLFHYSCTAKAVLSQLFCNG
jgi:hypothetical protein